jgi:hypothetical protein
LDSVTINSFAGVLIVRLQLASVLRVVSTCGPALCAGDAAIRLPIRWNVTVELSP